MNGPGKKEIGPIMNDFLHFTKAFIASLEAFGPKTAEGGPVPRLLLKGTSQWLAQGTVSLFEPFVKGQMYLTLQGLCG